MIYYIWLQLCLGQGSKTFERLLEAALLPKDIYSMSHDERKKLGYFSKGELEKLSNTLIDDAVKIIEQCERMGIKLVSYDDDNYPATLKSISTPPMVLYVKGRMPDFDNTPVISIVGPRKVSEFGKKAAYSLGYRLGKAGFTIVSGGAVGSDTYAHIGALKANTKTVLIMGCGFNVSYLEENRPLREHIEKCGCLISEYPPDTPITCYTFPVRNRLISALSLGTIVVEAGKRSGALITANHAIEQGRDVFVVPGSPERSEYKGSNALLRDGAKPLLDASDIFNEYIHLFPQKINIEKAYEKEPKPVTAQKNKKILNETLSNEAKIVYNCLDTQKFYPDQLDTGLDGSKLLSALTELEMEFIIRALPGGQYEICK
ncbi:MAG: DNA-processing protein DprA [Clostridia bacterium]|nr:DNA-processing protein DprA [Clostridia bacterium]